MWLYHITVEIFDDELEKFDSFVGEAELKVTVYFWNDLEVKLDWIWVVFVWK